MSAAYQLLTRLAEQGISVSVEDDSLRYRAPQGAMSPEIREALKTHKSELITLLQAGITISNREGPPYPDGLGLVKCFYCSKLTITGGVCQVFGKSMSGIALLQGCSNFIMTTATVH